MPSTLDTQPVRTVLDQLFTLANENDPPIFARIDSTLDRLGGERRDSRVPPMLKDAFMPIGREAGRFLYQLARYRPAQLIVEFGMSFGLSTIHLAAAVKDNGIGRVITTEMEPTKVQRAIKHLQDADLLDSVEIREGDALETLATIDDSIDLLFLDGWKDLYLPVLRLLEPRLRPGALVVADDLNVMPKAIQPYLDHVRDPANGFVSVTIPLDDHLELSQWTKQEPQTAFSGQTQDTK